MIQVKLVCSLVLFIFLAACGSSSKFFHPLENSAFSAETLKKYSVGRVYSKLQKVPVRFMSAIAENLKAALKEKGMLEEDKSAPSNVINIEVLYYRMRNWFNRVMFGMMAGKDGVNSIVNIVDKQNKKQIGELFVSSFNLSIFIGKNGISKMHAEEIAEALEKAGK